MSNKSNLELALGDWYTPLLPVLETQQFKDIPKRLAKLKNCVPKKTNIFRAFELCQLKDLRVVIINSTPSNMPGITPNGLAFGQEDSSLRLSGSLEHIRTKLEKETNQLGLNFDITLENWATQGVLLLQKGLTYNNESTTRNHEEMWEPFFTQVIKTINERHTGIVFLMWGTSGKVKQVNSKLHHIIYGPHPVLSEFVSGEDYFTKTNALLKGMNNETINWL